MLYDLYKIKYTLTGFRQKQLAQKWLPRICTSGFVYLIYTTLNRLSSDMQTTRQLMELTTHVSYSSLPAIHCPAQALLGSMHKVRVQIE